MATYPTFGAQTGFIRATKANRSDQAELVMGRHTEVFVRSTRKECSATKSDCSWGIEPFQGLIFDTVRLTVDDEPDLNYTAAQDSTQPLDPNLPLMKAKCCIIRRGRVTLTLDGKGNPGWALGSALPTYPDPYIGQNPDPYTGANMSLELKVAIGTLDLTPTLATLTAEGCTWKLVNYTVTDTDRDWEKFTAEFQGFIDANAQGDSVAQSFVDDEVSPPACDCPDDLGHCCDSYRMEWSLNGEGYAEKTGTVTKNPRVVLTTPTP